MSAPAIPARSRTAGAVREAMAATLRTYWRESTRYQRFLYGLAVAFLASAAFHGVVFLIDGGPWLGAVSWRKPIEFALSFALATASLAWILTFLPRHPVVGWAVSGVWAVATAGETALITMQRWRGVASHFNSETPFDSAVFGAMGALIIVVAAVVAAVTLWSFVSLRADPALRWAILMGLVLLLVGQGIGFFLLGEGFAQSAAGTASSPVTVPPQGALTLPHAIALHGLQVILLLGWLLLFTSWPVRVRVLLVLTAAIAYAGLVLVLLQQALNGRAPLDLGGAVAMLSGVAVAIIAGAFLTTAAGVLRRPLRPV